MLCLYKPIQPGTVLICLDMEGLNVCHGKRKTKNALCKTDPEQ
jgi:hypothetical protein